jgi:hypothetical protein
VGLVRPPFDSSIGAYQLHKPGTRLLEGEYVVDSDPDLETAGSLHTLTSDEPDFVSRSSISPSDSLHNLTADIPDIGYSSVLADDSTHSVSSDAPDIALFMGDYINVEQSGTVTTAASTTYSTAVATDSVILPAGTYIGLWSMELTNAGNGFASGRLLINGVEHVRNGREPWHSSERMFLGGVFFYTSDGVTPATFAVEGNGNASGSSNLQNARLTLFNKGADDYTYSGAGGSTTSATYVTLDTYTFTPTTTGEYVILLSHRQTVGNEAITKYFQATLNGTTIPSTSYSIQPGWTTQAEPVAHLYRVNLTGGVTYTIDMNARVSSAGTTTAISQTRIAAFRTDRFQNRYAAHLASTSSSAGGTGVYITPAAGTVTFTPQAVDHLVIGNATANSEASLGSVRWRDAGVAKGEYHIPGRVDTRHFPAITHYVANYTAVSRTIEIQRRSTSSGLSELRNGSGIVALDLAGFRRWGT